MNTKQYLFFGLSTACLLFCILGCGTGKIAEASPLPESAAVLIGTWNGTLEVQGQKLPLAFHFTLENGCLTGTMDSPSQGAHDLPMTAIRFDEGTFSASYMRGTAKLEGPLEGVKDTMAVEWVQGGRRFPLNLIRGGESEASLRPQEPKRPFPYLEENVTFENPDEGISLAGTLTMPEGDGPFPAVLLVSGSGQQNRDEEVFGHKPFLIISDYLTRRGMAVLRYDDRGVGSSGGFETLESMTTIDFAGDAAAGLSYLRSRPEILPGAVGLLGHSEGGMIGEVLAGGDDGPDFLVLMAGPALQGRDTLLHQSRAIMKTMGLDDDAINQTEAVNNRIYDLVIENPDDLEEKVLDLLIRTGMDRGEAEGQAGMIHSPWFRCFLSFRPADYLTKIDIPVLALFGGRDTQVVAEAEAPAMGEALGRSESSDVTVEIIPGLNHLFQEAETGSPDEYAGIEQTVSPIFLDRVGRWLEELGFLDAE